MNISYTAFIDKINSGEIRKVSLEGDTVSAEAGSGAEFKLYRPMDAELTKLLIAKHIEFSAKPQASTGLWIQLGLVFLVLAPLFFVMKRMAVFGRSRAQDSWTGRTRRPFHRCGRSGGSKIGPARDSRISERPEEVLQARRKNADRRSARRPSRVRERPFSPGRWPAKPAFPSLPCPDPSLSRCTWGSARPG